MITHLAASLASLAGTLVVGGAGWWLFSDDGPPDDGGGGGDWEPLVSPRAPCSASASATRAGRRCVVGRRMGADTHKRVVTMSSARRLSPRP